MSRLPARRRGALALGLLLALGVWSAPALSQTPTIPDAAITSTSQLSQPQLDAVRTYVAHWSPGLTGESPAQIAEARRELLAPLERTNVGVPFRLSYGNEIATAVERNLESDREVVVVNGLRLLGEVATDRSIGLIDRVLGEGSASTPGGGGGFASRPVGVRYAAIYAVARTFGAVATDSQAVAPERVRSVMSRVGQIIGTEEDPLVLDVAVRALMAAGSIDKPTHPGIRAEAHAILAQSVSGRVRALDPAAAGASADRLYFVLRAVVATRDALTDRRSLPATAAQPCAALGGDVLAFARARLDAGVEWPSEERRLLGQAVTVSQATIYFAGTAMAPATNLPTPEDLGRLINPANPSDQPRDADFLRRAPAEIARLTASPYNFPSGRFDR